MDTQTYTIANLDFIEAPQPEAEPLPDWPPFAAGVCTPSRRPITGAVADATLGLVVLGGGFGVIGVATYVVARMVTG